MISGDPGRSLLAHLSCVLNRCGRKDNEINSDVFCFNRRALEGTSGVSGLGLGGPYAHHHGCLHRLHIQKNFRQDGFDLVLEALFL